jgi:hypothetical protein
MTFDDGREEERMTYRQKRREFLLGGLAPKDADAMEERMFADDAFYEELDEEHEALAEEYVAKSLAGEEAARFERQRSLSPELANKVAELRDLKTLLERRREARSGGAAARSFLRPLPVVMAVCLFGLAISACVQWRESRRLRAELAQRVEEPQVGVKAVPAQAGPSEGVVFLAAGVVRGPEDVARVEIAPGASLVQLQIEVPAGDANTKSWLVEVSRDGREMFRSDAVFARHAGSISYLPVYIAAESFPDGSYSVRIRSTDLNKDEKSRMFTIGHALSPGSKLHGAK